MSACGNPPRRCELALLKYLTAHPSALVAQTNDLISPTELIPHLVVRQGISSGGKPAALLWPHLDLLSAPHRASCRSIPAEDQELFRSSCLSVDLVLLGRPIAPLEASSHLHRTAKTFLRRY